MIQAKATLSVSSSSRKRGLAPTLRSDELVNIGGTTLLVPGLWCKLSKIASKVVLLSRRKTKLDWKKKKESRIEEKDIKES